MLFLLLHDHNDLLDHKGNNEYKVSNDLKEIKGTNETSETKEIREILEMQLLLLYELQQHLPHEVVLV